MRKSLVAVCVAAAVLHVAPAFAQGDGGPDPSSVRVRIGPLMMNPAIAISNIGIDHNVFNDPPDQNPKQDFTVTVTPTTDFWLHLGPTWLTASLNEQINWFQKYASERTANNQFKLGWSATGARITFKVSGSYINARERPGFEIDTRASRKETGFDGTLDFHALAKSFIGLTATRDQTRFADDAVYQGTSLKDTLNRVGTSVGVHLRHQLTPLTSISFEVSRSNDHFEFSPNRDANSTIANGTLSFDPAALVKGSITGGFTDYSPVAGDLPGFRGFTGSASLTYVLLGTTRFALTGNRAVQYSYDANQPYYVLSGIGGSVAQQVFGPVDVQVRGDSEVLGYRDRSGVTVQVSNRTDHVITYGVGVGFHLGKDLRLSFNVDKVNRDTQVTDHQYDNFKFGSTLNYGF